MKFPLCCLCSLLIALSVSSQTPAPDDDKESANRIVEITSEAEAKVTLDPLVGAEIWTQTAEQVEADYAKKGFAWLSKTSKDRALIRPRRLMLKEERKGSDDSSTVITYKSMKHSFELFGRPAQEVEIEFAGGKVASLSISIWNKGDARQGITEVRFKELVAMTVASIDPLIGVRGRDLGKDASGAVRMSRWRWETPARLAQLEFSSSRDADRSFQAEFLRLRLMPRTRSVTGATTATAAPRPMSNNLVKNIVKAENGDVYIGNVPMVDQGEKGYCAVASTERVMRYYGLQVDQHELAKAASTTAGRGTNPSEFEDALHTMQGKLQVKMRDLINFERRDFEKLVQNYNREARKLGGKSWAEGDYYFDANPDILREARCRNGAYEKFRGYIVAATDRGMPLLWALHLGRYPETGRENPQGGGGHMRTIIGYNAKTDEIIFSDSWGAGHEFKKMKGRDACGATLGLYLVEPSNR